MSNETFALTPVPSFRTEAIEAGYVFECSCGELYNNVAAAYNCRKCRKYCVFGWCTHVTNIKTGRVVAGEVPSEAEYAEAAAHAEAQAAEERAEFEFQLQMWNKEGELYEQEMARRAEEAALAAAELAEDQLYMIQDNLMGVA